MEDPPISSSQDSEDTASTKESQKESDLKKEISGQQSSGIEEIAQQIAQHQGSVSQRLETIENDLLQKLKKDQTLREAFDKLYGEMEQYKNNFVRSATKPLVLDLILLFDNMLRSEKRVEDQATRQILEDLREELEEILYRRDVEKMPKKDTTINRKLQRAVKTIPTDNREEDGHVVEVIREGFMWEDTVLRPQEVIIKKHKTS